MNSDKVRRTVMSELSRIKHPGTNRDLVAGGHVQGLEFDPNGIVRFQFLLRPDDPPDLVKTARLACEAVDGVSEVKIDVQLPQMAPAGETGRQGGLQPGSVPAPTPKPGILPSVKQVIAVSSGKGGVGKSMVSANLACSFARSGRSVGLLDADIYGPNIPLMFGVDRRPNVTGAKGNELIEPLEAHGVRLMSLGFLLDKEQPAIMRGPLVSGILKQFLEQVEWGPLDIMVVDMPPGTGDAQLSLVQAIELDGAVMVTTPQDVSTGDVRRGVKMFERVNTRVLGIVENMSGLACPHCEEVINVFGSGGGSVLAKEMKVPFLGKIPLDPQVREAGDKGAPTVVSSPDSRAGEALTSLMHTIDERLAVLDGQ